MIYRHLSSKSFLWLLTFLMSATLLSAQPDLGEGKELFRANCATCHNKNMKQDMTGPALGGVEERWADYPREDLYKWVRASQALIQSGHPRANELWNQWKPNLMQNFGNLTDAQIDNILAYVDDVYVSVPVVVPPGGGGTAGIAAEQGSNALLYTVLAAILGLLALVLARIIANLNNLAEVREGTATTLKKKSLYDIVTSKGVLGFALFAVIVGGGYTTVNNAIDLGRQQGYTPDQPIKFSHAIHAGQQQIDCQYCHDGARRSKHSVIPAANTCMNCHKAIKVGSTYGTSELSKIFASIGYNPSTDTYIEDYAQLPQEEVEKIYKKWIVDQFVQSEDAKARFSGVKLVTAAEKEATKQWGDIVSSLTNEVKKTVQGPIEWVRIHNLPDHVYFNHAQHVSVGKVECQQCHGQIENMEVVGQYAPLSMGWCINCHRETEVKFADNPYYQSYEKYHEELKDGSRNKVTVEDIGGLECQKCHY